MRKLHVLLPCVFPRRKSLHPRWYRAISAQASYTEPSQKFKVSCDDYFSCFFFFFSAFTDFKLHFNVFFKLIKIA